MTAVAPIQTLVEKSPSYLKDDLLEINLSGDLSGEVKNYLERCRELIFDKMDQGVKAARLVRLQSLLMDQLLTALYHRGFEESQAKGVLPIPMAIFAQGGYGRAELNLYSDIDLLIIYEGKSGDALEMIVNKMLYPLWDAKVAVGYATRTIEDCQRAMTEDVRVMSSILDARFLAGDKEIAQKFFAFLESKTSTRRTLKQFIKSKIIETKERLKKFGGSVYVVEPNLKESEGGLRDWHTLRYFARLATKSPNMDDWIRSGLINNEEAEQLRRALDFILEVRNHLHRIAGKAQDQLAFEFQKPLAIRMGFQSGEGKLEAEKFMQAYYAHAAHLHRLRIEVTRRILSSPRSPWRRLLNRLRPSLGAYFINVGGMVLPRSFRRVEAKPEEIVRAFWWAQKKKLGVDEGFKSWVSRHLDLIDEKYRSHEEVCRLMREMIADAGGIGKTLKEMHDCRLLGVLIPEFGQILHQTQHDVYHVYTVDSHSIKAVQEVSDLCNGHYDEEFPLFKKAFSEIKNKTHIVLGTLFHDIGKGKGGRHSEVGAKLGQAIMKRLGYDEADRAMVEFLVLSHLMMPHLSQRRDLEDINLINNFAKSMETLDKLNLLYVLTWADIRAVGPDVWTPWKGNLLSELYSKTREVLEKGEFTAERAVEIMKQVQDRVRKLVPKRLRKQGLDDYLENMPPRYFLANEPEAILEHFELLNKAANRQLVFRSSTHTKGKYNEIFIFTENNPRLFEWVTGVMAANQMNILGLEQFFDTQGGALILLNVTDQRGGLIEENRRFKNVERDLRQVLSGEVSIGSYYKSRHRPLLASKKYSGKPPRVEIDQDVSPYYTVIDIYADDRIGLLYDLAQVMRRLNLYVEVSKISTKVDQVSDAFYVQDIFGHKINERGKARAIKQSLQEALEKPVHE